MLKIGESKSIGKRLRDYVGGPTDYSAKQGEPALWRAFAGKRLRVQWREVPGGKDEALAKYRREAAESQAISSEVRLPLWDELVRGPCPPFVADRDPTTGPACTQRVLRTVANRRRALRRKLARRD